MVLGAGSRSQALAQVASAWSRDHDRRSRNGVMAKFVNSSYSALMARTDSMASEFEAIGEAEVRRHISHKDYDAPHLAHALRWLGDKAAERSAGRGPGQDDTDGAPAAQAGDRTLDAVARLALGGAGLAAVAGLVVGVLGHH